MRLHINTSKHEETLKKQTNEIKLNIEMLNEKIKTEINEKYDEKKKQEKLKKDKEKKDEEERINKIRAKRAQQESRYMIISCPCGSQFQKREQNRHEKCKQHIDFLQTQNKQQ